MLSWLSSWPPQAWFQQISMYMEVNLKNSCISCYLWVGESWWGQTALLHYSKIHAFIHTNGELSARGSPASIIAQTSNLFHFLERLPLVSSEYKTKGTITTGRPWALALNRWHDAKQFHSMRRVLEGYIYPQQNLFTISENHHRSKKPLICMPSGSLKHFTACL